MAALLAAAAVPMPEIPLVSLSSEGVILVCGRDEKAVEAARLLKDRLDVTVLLSKPGAVAPARVSEFPVAKGTVVAARGHLGAFELTVDDYALPAASSRDKLDFDTGRDGAKSRCDLILDLCGGAPLFPAHELRDGYLRADPNDPAAILRAVMKAADLVGTFDKPRYITFTESLCAHSRSKIVGCNRCLNLCPTGAITPNGDQVSIDANVCAGCGACAAVCPTGAAAYAFPPVDTLIGKIRTLLSVYREAGGANPILLLHDGEHGLEMIELLARHGDGLPANVIPVQVNEVTQIGLETFAAAFAYGAASMRLLMRARPKHETGGTVRTISYADTILKGLGFGENRIATIETDDPDVLGSSLYALAGAKSHSKTASFMPLGRKRDIMRSALRELQGIAPAPVDVIALPEHAPFGKIEVNAEGCTLCLACVSACDRRAFRQPRKADAEILGGRLRSVRTLQGDLPGKGYFAASADRLPRGDCRSADHEGRRAVRMHPLREAVRHPEHDRAYYLKTRRPPLDVPGPRAAARTSEDVRGLPCDRGDGRIVRPA